MLLAFAQILRNNQAGSTLPGTKLQFLPRPLPDHVPKILTNFQSKNQKKNNLQKKNEKTPKRKKNFPKQSGKRYSSVIKNNNTTKDQRIKILIFQLSYTLTKWFDICSTL